MKKNYFYTGITIGFFLIAGVCYSCSYKAKEESAAFVSSLENSKDGKTQDQALKGDDSQEETLQEVNLIRDETTDLEQAYLYAHICGAVVMPGVYQAKSNARLIDLIELAGGLREDAAEDYINQAQGVKDGQRIYIPTREEIRELSVSAYIEGDKSSQETSKEAAAKININEAGEEELMSLSGVGQSKASSIIKYRNENGNFKAIEELMNIPGIKEGLFNQISSYITIN